MKPYGKVNIVSLLVIAGVVGGLWWLIVVGPAYLDNLDVKQFVTDAVNQVPQNRPDESLKRYIIEQTNRVGDHLADDGFGNISWQPGLGITNDDITIERDDVHNYVLIRVEYTRVRLLKPFPNKEKRIRFRVEKSGVLKR